MIRYDLLVQEALRGVVRRVLTDTARDGVPGEHHYYVSFRTQAPGVRISNRLREKYPDEMTIVLQHQFWDLGVTEHTFEVGLAFGGIPERLLVPFDAVSAFYDPSVQFGLKFEVAGVDVMEDDQEQSEPVGLTPVTRIGAKPDRAKASKLKIAPAETAIAPVKRSAAPKKTTLPLAAPVAEKTASENETSAIEKPPKSDPKPTADVVSLDAFRKKN